VPSERSAPDRGTRHKTLIDYARQMLLQIARWLPPPVTPSSFARGASDRLRPTVASLR